MLFQPRTLSGAKKWILYLWTNFIITQFVFIYIANLIARQRTGSGQVFVPFTNLTLFIYLFSFLAIVSIIYGLYMHRMIPMVFLKGELKRVTDKVYAFDSELNDELLARGTFLYSIIIGSCYTSCGCYGLFLFLLGGNSAIVYPFAALSLVGLIICRPSNAYYERVVQRVQEWKLQQNR